MKRDRYASELPTAPRALTGNASQPVFGHTWMFSRLGGDIASEFPPHWNEIKWLPRSWTRQLGETFSIFIWGQWRVVVRGPERVRSVLDSGYLKEGWAWSPPVTLLGKSCMSLLDEQECDFLGDMLANPLSQASAIKLAPEFAEIAESFVTDLVSGKFNRKGQRNCEETVSVSEGSEFHEERNTNIESFKIHFDHLRSYTFDLVDGPILRMHKWRCPSEQSKDETAAETDEDEQEVPADDKKALQRSTMLLWMDRLKRALCVIKMTFGAEWMYIWFFNEYGRAVNARMHLEEEILEHITRRAKLIPVTRLHGHVVHDPMAMPFPIVSRMCPCLRFAGNCLTCATQITLAENVLRRNETVTGESAHRPSSRARSNSDSQHDTAFSSVRGLTDNEDDPPIPRRGRSMSSPTVLSTGEIPPEIQHGPALSTLDRLLRQEDDAGSGLTHAAIMEVSILLWMMMDAGNAWTAMALNLLALDETACESVQKEIDDLVGLHSKENLFTPQVLGKMNLVDALLYEAIRLCPQFMGGMKVLSETVEISNSGVQIPKNTNVIFCQPTEEPFDLSAARGKKPEELGFKYPCAEL